MQKDWGIAFSATSKIESGRLSESVSLTYDYNVISESHENGFDHYDMEVIEQKRIQYVASGKMMKTTVEDFSFAGNNVQVQTRNNRNNWANTNNVTLATLSSNIQVESTQEVVPNGNITQTIEQTFYYERFINREIHTTDIKVEAIEWTVKNDKGEDQKVNYTTSNPLELFRDYVVPGTDGETVKRQYIYLSQCYSKNYPFFVNVVFEQVQ